jgi:hypothetical protein
MKPSSKEQFKEQFVRRTLSDQIQSYLCALAARNGGLLEFDYEEVMNIQDGETCIAFVDGDKIRLRYSPEMSLVYTIRRSEGPQQWQSNQTPQTATSALHDDAALAEMEARQKRQADLRQQAEQMRQSDPLVGASRLRTSRNSPV